MAMLRHNQQYLKLRANLVMHGFTVNRFWWKRGLRNSREQAGFLFAANLTEQTEFLPNRKKTDRVRRVFPCSVHLKEMKLSL